MNRGGFTLLEVLVALTVASMAAVISFTVFAIPLRTLVLDAHIVRAKGVAERTFLEVMMHPCDWASAEPTIQQVEDEGLTFTRTVEVGVFPGTDLWRIAITVTWTTAQRPYRTHLVYHHPFYGLVCAQWLPPYAPVR